VNCRVVSESLNTQQVVERVEDVLRGLRELDSLIYGSTITEGSVVGDVDVWLDGDFKEVTLATSLLAELGATLGVTFDIARPSAPTDGVVPDEAVLWCVHHEGLVVSGRRPECPPGMTFERTEAAYRTTVALSASRFALEADALARAGVESAASYVDASLRLFVRSLARNHADERLVRRLGTRAQLRLLETIDPGLTKILTQHAWHSTHVTDRVAALIA
jgi:hypothetical protein